MTGQPPGTNRPNRPNRRSLLGYAGAGTAVGIAAVGGAVGGGVGGYALGSAQEAHARAAAYAFEGKHQAGIVTPAQDRLHFAAFDLTTDSRAELIELLREWTDAARDLTRGR